LAVYLRFLAEHELEHDVLEILKVDVLLQVPPYN
jgi:hypothetical protein